MSGYKMYFEEDGESVSVAAVFNKLGGVEGAKRFLSDELVLGERAPKPTPPPSAPEPPLDFTVRVDRALKPVYPDWTEKVMGPELEGTGPAEYDLQSGVEQWLHDDQKTGVVKGQRIYDHLKTTGALADQLGLADLLAIQAKGIVVFRKLYAEKAVYGWKSVVERRLVGGRFWVPVLYERGGKVVSGWNRLVSNYHFFDSALRFRTFRK